ncbi:MAG: hypothetical protein ABI423_07990 [Burkholderiales bacterium]
MTPNPYETPRADVEQDENLPVRPITGIFSGVLIDLGGTILVVSLINFFYAIYIASKGATAAEVQQILTTSDPSSALGMLNSLAGMVMSYLAGFYCLRISRGTNLRYPLILATIVLVIGLAAGLGWSDMNVFLLLGFSILTVVVTLLGGANALRQSAKVVMPPGAQK